ncbi:MAG: M28 family peptidase [Persephonella sp.]|nr:M28 family peptidase [Persephonella sp.]
MESKSPVERLKEDVSFLSSLRPFRNYMNIDSLNRSAEYIYRRMENYADSVSFQKFKVEGRTYKNVIGAINLHNSKRIVIGAHYDVAGNTPGADDNASGVAGLLEILRILSKNRPSCRVDFAAYTLEEPPFFGTKFMGSFVHASSLFKEKADITVMISLEMIGYFSDEPRSQQFPLPFFRLFYPDRGNFIGVVGKIGQSRITKKIRNLMRRGSSIPVYSINAPVLLPGVDFSDHRNFWHFGYNAVMITDTAFYRNPYYHTRGDTIATLNFEKMYQVVKGISYAVYHL